MGAGYSCVTGGSASSDEGRLRRQPTGAPQWQNALHGISREGETVRRRTGVVVPKARTGCGLLDRPRPPPGAVRRTCRATHAGRGVVHRSGRRRFTTFGTGPGDCVCCGGDRRRGGTTPVGPGMRAGKTSSCAPGQLWMVRRGIRLFGCGDFVIDLRERHGRAGSRRGWSDGAERGRDDVQRPRPRGRVRPEAKGMPTALRSTAAAYV